MPWETSGKSFEIDRDEQGGDSLVKTDGEVFDEKEGSEGTFEEEGVSGSATPKRSCWQP